jgi:mRNA-degrading endonuclease RelE of RelBE toxin-antitoxin system
MPPRRDECSKRSNKLPLEGSDKRSARVGKYRILLLIIKEKNALVVTEIDSRGQVYRKA